LESSSYGFSFSWSCLWTALWVSLSSGWSSYGFLLF
jgi:hypothetical protein